MSAGHAAPPAELPPLVVPGTDGGLRRALKDRYLLRLLVRRELKARYKGSLLGLGWSACLIGGSAMLVESVPAHIRVPLQGGVDASMNFGAAALGALAGPVLALGGFFAVNVMAAVVLAVLVGAGIRAALRRRSTSVAGTVEGTAIAQED